MEYTNDFDIKPIDDTILAILCQLRHNNSMLKKWWVFLIIISVLGGIFCVFWYLSSKFSWDSVNNQLETGISADISEITFETPLYGAKYDYSVSYIRELLGENVELSDYVVVVDISEQSEYIFDKSGNLIDTNRISTGKLGSSQEMSKSLWRVVSKTDSSLGAIYGPRLMLLDRYISSGWIDTTIALHGTEEPEKIGTPFGLGCFYHNNADIIALFDLLEIGTYVVAIE